MALQRGETSWRIAVGNGARVIAFGGALVACGASNVLLTLPPGGDPGPLGPVQECDAVERPCEAGPQDTSIYGSQGTTKLSLPTCRFGIEKIFVQNAGSSNPVAFVQCAAPSQAPTGDAGIPLFGSDPH